MGTAAYSICSFVILEIIGSKVAAQPTNLPKIRLSAPEILVSSAAAVMGYILFVLPHASKKYLSAAAWGAVYGLIIHSSHALTTSDTMGKWLGKENAANLATQSISCALLAILQTYLKRAK